MEDRVDGNVAVAVRQLPARSARDHLDIMNLSPIRGTPPVQPFLGQAENPVIACPMVLPMSMAAPMAGTWEVKTLAVILAMSGGCFLACFALWLVLRLRRTVFTDDTVSFY